MKYFQHRSAGSFTEMFLELGHQIKQVLEKCRKANVLFTNIDCFLSDCPKVLHRIKIWSYRRLLLNVFALISFYVKN